jgi:hypothetical protein
MTEALRLGFVTLKLLPRSQTHEQRDTLYQAMEVAVNVFTVNKDYAFDGPAITSAHMLQVSETERALNETFNSRLIPAFRSVAEVERSLESETCDRLVPTSNEPGFDRPSLQDEASEGG